MATPTSTTNGTRSRIDSYLELASPQLLENKWRELEFDLESRQNVLQDFAMPESGAGHVFRDAKVVGSPVHNRLLYWRTLNDVIEFVEVSTEVVLEGNQVRIKFTNSPIISSLNVIEFSDSVVIMLATLNSVHRMYLPHPKTTSKSILCEITNDALFNPSNYYILSTQISVSTQQPLCATSWYDKSMLKCALSLPDSSLLIVQFAHLSHQISVSEIKQIGIIGRIWSRMPNPWARNQNNCDNAIFISTTYNDLKANDILLITLCRDLHVRIFSTNSRECVCNQSIISQNSFTQSMSSHTNTTTDLPAMKVFGSQIIVYLTETRPEFTFLELSSEDGLYSLQEKATIQADWDKLIDFSVSSDKIWALAFTGETESSLCFMDLTRVFSDDNIDNCPVETSWDFVTRSDEDEKFLPPTGRSWVEQIFWSNQFSATTVHKALHGMIGSSAADMDSMESLEETAYTRIVDNDQDEAWERFYNYCLQSHQVANKNIGLVVAQDESVVCIIKRSNPSFVCPWMMSIDMILQSGPYRGIEFSPSMRGILESLDYISKEIVDDESASIVEVALFDNSQSLLTTVERIVKKINPSKFDQLPRLTNASKNLILSGIDQICKSLDLTEQANSYNIKILDEHSAQVRCEHNPLESNVGIILTFEKFRRLVRARMNLARDLLVYIAILNLRAHGQPPDKISDLICEDLFDSGKARVVIDVMRAYASLLWFSETQVKAHGVSRELISFLSPHFQFFKKPCDSMKSPDSSLEQVINRNLFMNFLARGGANLSWPASEVFNSPQSLSGSFYITETCLNLCKLMWPKSGYLCCMEYMFTNHLDDQLSNYIDLTSGWVELSAHDRQFIKAANSMLQNRGEQAVDTFNKLWNGISRTNLLGRFLNLDTGNDSNADKLTVTPSIIFRYYERLLEFFQIFSNRHCLVMLVNHCLSLVVPENDEQTNWVNSLRAKSFQYHLELNEYDDAYHTMVLTTDSSLRINCLRKFIVSHCEKEQWCNLLSYPFIDIKEDFIDILNQKAESLDLSSLSSKDFYKTSYYDLLFASYVSDGEYKKAAEIMYNYSQRLAQEAPGITSIRKQADCLLIALNCLRCVEEKDNFIDSGIRPEARSRVLKRPHDTEASATGDTQLAKVDSLIDCKDLERKYELTKARIKLLEKDQASNAIALSPLGPEEVINLLVASSIFSTAIDIALLFSCPLEPIFEGLTARYRLVVRLSPVDLAINQDIDISDIFSSYRNISTYNYIANSTAPLADRLWRLIEHYLEQFSETPLLRVVATKLLAAGHDVPASLKRMYKRNAPEILKLLIKFDHLMEAADLATEMIDRIIETKPPYYLPTHLIISLISHLSEDATDSPKIEAAAALTDKLSRFRSSMVKMNCSLLPNITH